MSSEYLAAGALRFRRSVAETYPAGFRSAASWHSITLRAMAFLAAINAFILLNSHCRWRGHSAYRYRRLPATLIATLPTKSRAFGGEKHGRRQRCATVLAHERCAVREARHVVDAGSDAAAGTEYFE